jgi:hypothetical protein
MRNCIAFCAVFLTCFGGILLRPFPVAHADQWFDSYGKVPWAEEKLHLDNFAMHLKDNPDMIGYVAFYVGKNDKEANTQKRVVRAKNYLLHGRTKIDKERIIVVNAGKREETRTVLQPVLKANPPPSF